MMLTEPVATVPFEEFIEHLRRNGFVIGVDSYLRIQELLDRVGGSYGPADLKTLLCPLVARSEEEQEAFYASFRKFYPGFELQLEAAQFQSAVAPLTAPVARKRQKWALAAFLAVAVVAILSVLFVWNTQRTLDPVFPVLLDKKQEAPQEPAPTPRPVDTPTPPAAARATPPIDRFNALGGWRVALPLLALLVWLALELSFSGRRKLILAGRQGLKPPSMWPLRTESQPF